MRITRRQLRRIIKEEKRKLLKEMGPGPRDDVKNDYDSGMITIVVLTIGLQENSSCLSL